MPRPPEQIGRYRILAEIGRGSMGTVYRAEDTRIGRIVALKTVAMPAPSGSPQEHEAYARFQREARAAGTLTHPAIVLVYDVGEDADHGLSYIAMEYLDGESLERILRSHKALHFDQVRAIGAQVADALAAAHAAGIVHRDIKPANLILSAAGQVKVTDFGIAKFTNAAMTQDGMFLGSPGYMSPEQVRAAEVDPRSDLFSLGTVLYELSTLRPAFPGKHVFEVIRLVVNGEFVPPRQQRPDLPDDLEHVILKAMSLDRKDRFQNAGEMREALLAALDPAVIVRSPRQLAMAAAGGPMASPATAPALPPRLGIEPAMATSSAPPAERTADTVALVESTPALAAAGVGRPSRQLVIGGLALAALLVTLLGLWSSGAGDGGAPATPAATPSATLATFPFSVPVQHGHLIGNCAGRLNALAGGLEFRANKGGDESRSWTYQDLVSVRFARGKIELVAIENRKERRYNFKVLGRVPEEVRSEIRARLRR